MKGTSDGSKGSPGISKRWLNALTMAASHGSAEAANTSAASIKSASQTVLGSALGTVRPIKIPISASDTRVESMNHEDAEAESDTRCRDYLGRLAKTAAIPHGEP
jgi:hypothetical protein